MNTAILITGSRDADSDRWRGVFASALQATMPATGTVVLIHGDARGADRGVADVARRSFPQVALEAYPADWNQYGNGAGPKRNAQMLRRLIGLRGTGYECRVLAFHDDMQLGKGTRNMVGIALDAGFDVIHYMSDGSRRRRVKATAKEGVRWR